MEDIHLLEDSNLMKKGTCVVANNMLCEGAQEYREYVKNDSKYKTKEYGSEVEYTFPLISDIVSVSMYLGKTLENQVRSTKENPY